MPLSPEELETTLRPLVVSLERALERLLSAGLMVPTRPVPRIEAAEDGTGRQWVEAEVDFFRLRLDAMPALEGTRDLLVAEAVLAGGLGLDAEPLSSGDRKWTPQGQVVDVFLEEYLRSAYGEYGNLHMGEELQAINEPTATALTAECERLSSFLDTERFAGTLVMPVGGVRVGSEELSAAKGVSVSRFPVAWRDELWRLAGWGSSSAKPLQGRDFTGVTAAITVAVHGEQLGGWDWSEAQANADRVRLALLLSGATRVNSRLSWLRIDGPFASYLSRLGTGAGLVRQIESPLALTSDTLEDDRAALLPELYEALATVPKTGPTALALRRLDLSSERQLAEDRLIDTWIAFEALFAPEFGTELRYRASLRIARYVGRDRDERIELFGKLRRAYDWRSRLVHGGSVEDADIKKLRLTFDDALAVSERALRLALSAWVVKPPSPDLHEIDDRFLN